MVHHCSSSSVLLVVISALLSAKQSLSFLTTKTTTSSLSFKTTTTKRNNVLPPLSSSKNNNDNNRGGLDKGFNLLEIASNVVPQGRIVESVKESWKFGWKRMMAELAPQDRDGMYQRPTYGFKGEIGTIEFPDEANRYHLYVGNPCPWCHRCSIVVYLLNLLDNNNSIHGITRLVDDPIKASRGGWIFDSKNRDPINNCKDLRELYNFLSPGYQGRCTAPLLVDIKTKKIVSNESADIVKMLNNAKFPTKKSKSNIKRRKTITEKNEEKETTNTNNNNNENEDKDRINLYPKELISKIDIMEKFIYNKINNGVYRCGFSTSQQSYNIASNDVREGLIKINNLLGKQKYLCSNVQITIADIYLLPTLFRMDYVYVPLFKAGGVGYTIQSLYPNIYNYLCRIWNKYPSIQKSINISDANVSYYKQLFPLNPGGIIPTPIITEETLFPSSSTTRTSSSSEESESSST